MSFSDLPNELLLLEIVSYLDDPCDIFALLRVDRRTYEVLIPVITRKFRKIRHLPLGYLVSDAAIFGWTRLLQAAIRRGGSVHEYQPSRRPAIVEAAHLGLDNIVRILLDNGADIEAQGGTALLCAVVCRNIGTVKLLLSRGAKVDSRPLPPWGSGVTSLGTLINGVRWRTERAASSSSSSDRTAAKNAKNRGGEFELIQMLLDAGADPKAPQADEHDEPLLLSVAGYSRDIVRLLVEYGVDVSARDFRGNSALHRCIRGTAYSDLIENFYEREVDIETMRFLVEMGVGVDWQNTSGRTCLHIAAHEGRDECIEFLLKHGADKRVLDREGNDAYQLWLDGREDGAYAGRESKRGFLLKNRSF